MSALQGKRLHKVVSYVYHNVPFYRAKMQAMDVSPDDIRTIFVFGDVIGLCCSAIDALPAACLHQISQVW
mgnify:CR=1 FL=1